MARSSRFSPEARGFIARRMRDFHAGRMRSSSGDLVTDPGQALAIAFSEARAKGLRVPTVPRMADLPVGRRKP